MSNILNSTLEHHKKEADTNHADAQLKTGMLYRENGNILEAMRYLIAAAHNSNAQAQAIITYVSNSAIGGDKNNSFYLLSDFAQKELIQNLIDTKITPALSGDGGGIKLVNYISGEKPQIWLKYLGTCSGCHLGSTSTADMLLKHFEAMIDKNVVLYLM
jgi:hypothetical protein